MWPRPYAPLTLLGRFRPDNGSSALFIHRCYSREVWRTRRSRVGLDLLAALLVWPLSTLGAMGWLTWHNGTAIKQRMGKGRVRQLWEQLSLAFTYSITPRGYYVFELYEDDKRRKAGQYLQRRELKGALYTTLKTNNAGVPLSPLADKVAFAARCQDHQIATIPVVMTLECGTVTHGNDREPTLPKIDLFIKPNHGKGGRGAERWDYQQSGLYQGTAGQTLTPAELLHHLKTLPFTEGCLIQPRVSNHPLIADLSNGALATVRIMTCRNERDGFEVTNAVFRMARSRNTVVDNFHAGGIAAKVDLDKGTLGPATDLGVRATTGWCQRHPDTGAPICGRILPLWPQVLELVQRAHAAFSDRVIVGWDVALTPDGPQLVEGNGAPDLDIIQRTHREPVGNARLGQLLAFHLARVLGTEVAEMKGKTALLQFHRTQGGDDTERFP
jgi:hypothetical protein